MRHLYIVITTITILLAPLAAAQEPTTPRAAPSAGMTEGIIPQTGREPVSGDQSSHAKVDVIVTSGDWWQTVLGGFLAAALGFATSFGLYRKQRRDNESAVAHALFAEIVAIRNMLDEALNASPPDRRIYRLRALEGMSIMYKGLASQLGLLGEEPAGLIVSLYGMARAVADMADSVASSIANGARPDALRDKHRRCLETAEGTKRLAERVMALLQKKYALQWTDPGPPTESRSDRT